MKIAAYPAGARAPQLEVKPLMIMPSGSTILVVFATAISPYRMRRCIQSSTASTPPKKPLHRRSSFIQPARLDIIPTTSSYSGPCLRRPSKSTRIVSQSFSAAIPIVWLPTTMSNPIAKHLSHIPPPARTPIQVKSLTSNRICWSLLTQKICYVSVETLLTLHDFASVRVNDFETAGMGV